MADSDLSDLQEEMNFSTPDRPLLEEATESLENFVLGSENERNLGSSQVGRNRRVLISDSSLTRNSGSMETFDERRIDTLPVSTYGLKDDDETEFQDNLGTLPKKCFHDKKKYKLLCVESSKSLCGAVMGQGVNFCANKNCATNHKTSEKVTILDGNLYVIKSSEKSRSTAFVEPTIASASLDRDVIESWTKSVKTLKQWAVMFQLAKAASETKGLATEQTLSEENNFVTQAKEYRTPKKEKIKQMIDTSLPEVYSSFIPETGSFSSEDDARNFMVHIETSFKTVSKEIFKLNKNQMVMQDLLDNGLTNLDLRLKDIEEEVGNKPAHLEMEYDAPNLWGSISTMASLFSSFTENKPSTLTEETMNYALHSALRKLELKNEEGAENLKSSIKFVKDTLINVSRTLKDQISANSQDIAYLDRTSSSRSIAGVSNNMMDNITVEVSDMKAQVDNLEARLTNMDSKGDCIKFHSLGFNSKQDSDAWLELHVPNGNFGLVVDFHTLMEHIHHSITGVDALKQLQNVYKLKMKTLSEALSVGSFEVLVPRFLSSSGMHMVIDNQQSYFSQIKTFKEWNNPNSGFKLRLKRELERFRRSHLSTIRESVSVRNPLYNLATSTLTESISWANGLINYIDLTYEEYSSGKFGAAKSWHVTTKLATALIKEVNKPREGALNSFEAGNAMSMSKVIFYAVLQSLDMMTAIAEMDYRDSPVVSTELVKFLSLNTAIDAVDRLELQSADYATNIKQLTKDSNTTQTAVNSVGNKADELKKAMDNIRKRLEVLEKKK